MNCIVEKRCFVCDKPVGEDYQVINNKIYHPECKNVKIHLGEEVGVPLCEVNERYSKGAMKHIKKHMGEDFKIASASYEEILAFGKIAREYISKRKKPSSKKICVSFHKSQHVNCERCLLYL